ncbi:Ig-like domain-containing protein [bacterium]|nr:Ig-like domain-containing protein [bacterium]
MRNRHHVWSLGVLLAALLVGGAALAQTPQTIVIDGVNDFLSVNEADVDTSDTQFAEIDLSHVHITNDAVNLYLGVEMAGGFGTTQMGIAIDVGTAAGGTDDPWGRAIEWSLAANKPDFMFYVNLDNNWQASYHWDGAAWAPLAAGPGALGMATGTSFKELAIMLGTLGVSAGAPINVEVWTTQDSPTKGPLDAAANDGSQLSTPGFTLWDTASDIPLLSYLPYTVQAAADPDPPVLTGIQPASYPVGTSFNVQFNEPVDATSAANTANYEIGLAIINSATRDASDFSVVHLELAAPLTASAALYNLRVTDVEDVAGNVITDNGVDNEKCFGLKEVVFRGRMSQLLANTAELPPYQFTVEGSKAPLTFDPIGDTGVMTDTGVDDIWEYTTTMKYDGDCGAGTASESFEWKFNFQGTTWEPLAGNRTHTLDLVNGAQDVIEVWWNDEDPTLFTTHDIDVIFRVDMSLSGYAPTDTVSINGSVLPLNFNVPSDHPLVDDGTGEDETAADGVFTGVITFPAGARKDVAYKFLLNSSYECDGQGDRSVFLNDELFDTIGGTLGPLALPTVKYDFCNRIWRPVEVVFSVDFNNTAWGSIDEFDVVTVNGTDNGAGFDWTVPSNTMLHDDGIAPDAVANDRIYTVSVVFPDSAAQNIEYKYLANDVYECPNQGNRFFSIDPDNFDAVGNPQILALDVYQICEVTDVPHGAAARLVLAQNSPNPFNPMTKIHFDVARAGRGELVVYNVRGEKVQTLRSGHFESGPGVVIWNGRTDDGKAVGSGVYFYRLTVGSDTETRRMVLLK